MYSAILLTNGDCLTVSYLITWLSVGIFAASMTPFQNWQDSHKVIDIDMDSLSSSPNAWICYKTSKLILKPSLISSLALGWPFIGSPLASSCYKIIWACVWPPHCITSACAFETYYVCTKFYSRL